MSSVGEPYDLVKAGTEFRHVYNEAFLPSSFNPFATGRFSARDADPPRAMLYAGETPDCALWETVLRDVVPQAAPPHGVSIPPVPDMAIACLRLKYEAPILDLGRLGVRWIAGADLKLRDRITVLTTVPKYTATHKEAIRLLAALPQASGFLWPSKQIGQDAAYVFYKPPLTSDAFETLHFIQLESAGGLSLIDRALARAGLRSIELALRAGVRVGLGTDLLGELHEHQTEELLIRGRLQKPHEVLRAATEVNAEILGQHGKLGVIAAGAYADLIVTRGNPLDDLDVLQHQGRDITLIVKAGQVVKRLV
jgi:hypothetical protein